MHRSREGARDETRLLIGPDPRRQLRDLLDRIRDVYLRFELDGTIVDVNRHVSVFGYDPGALPGRRVQSLLEDPRSFDRALVRVLRDGRVEDFEIRALRADGEAITVSVNAWLDRARQNPCIEGLIRDIPDRKRQEDGLRAAKVAAGVAAWPRRILLVEDNTINQKLVVRLLTSRGHHVEVAADGEQALTMFSTRGPFDVVLMDMLMPVMDGYEAMRRIREREGPRARRTPLVAMTARAFGGERESCREAGADDYLSKPFAPEELYRIVESALTEGGEAEAKSSSLDRETLLHRVDGNRVLYVEMMRGFADLAEGLIAGVQQAVPAGDVARLERAAHTLKSAVSIFGATAARDLAHDIEMLGRRGDLHSAGPLVAPLAAAVRSLAGECQTEIRRLEADGLD